MLLFFADGFNGDAEQFCSAVTRDCISLAGFQVVTCIEATRINGWHSNRHGWFGCCFSSGNIKIGIEYDHGWDPVGSQFRVTRSRGFWLRTLTAVLHPKPMPDFLVTLHVIGPSRL
ncbi:MAG: hypothetical protein IPN96_15975 [Anaerolineales bacterium]|nr:hypothetical protein [Anaerolineales bacterium]